MKKFKLQVHFAIDGFMAKANSVNDRMAQNWAERLIDDVGKLTVRTNCFPLTGLLENLSPYWSVVASYPENTKYQAEKKFWDRQKIVLCKTLKDD